MGNSATTSAALARYEKEFVKLIEEEGAILDCADAEARDLSAADMRHLDVIEARRDKLTSDLDRHTRALHAKADLAERRALLAAHSDAARITGG